MHYHAEIIMPPTADVELAVRAALGRFCEHSNERDDDDGYDRYAFWDWYVIGGRWSGDKLMQMIDEERRDAFFNLLKAKGVTVSGLVWGKQELEPKSQEAAVDALWREHFPDSTFDKCPLFKHAGDALDGDILTLEKTGRDITAHRVLICAADGEPLYMATKEIWNGVTWQATSWAGTIGSALDEWADKLGAYKEDYAAARTPAADWLVVTVDYHS